MVMSTLTNQEMLHGNSPVAQRLSLMLLLLPRPLRLPTLRLLLCKNLQETPTITIQPLPACTMMVMSILTNQEMLHGNSPVAQRLSLMLLLLPRPLRLPQHHQLLCKNLLKTPTITIQPPPACTMMVMSILTNQEMLHGNSPVVQRLSLMLLLLPRKLLLLLQLHQLLCKNLLKTPTITIQLPPACMVMVTSTLTNQET